MIHSARASLGRKLILGSRTHFQASQPKAIATVATRNIVVRNGFTGKASPAAAPLKKCVPGGIRTPNLLIRSQMLYPVELQTQKLKSQVPRFQIPKSEAANWSLGFGFWDLSQKGGRRESNPQQPEPQSAALPLSCDHRRDCDSSFSIRDCRRAKKRRQCAPLSAAS